MTVLSAITEARRTSSAGGARHCEPFRIVFANNDPSVQLHNVSIFPAAHIPSPLFYDDPFRGQRTVAYEVPGLPAGEYFFVCTTHRDAMRGTLVVSGP